MDEAQPAWRKAELIRPSDELLPDDLPELADCWHADLSAVHGLLAAGNSEREAARTPGLSRGTVHRFAAAAASAEKLLGKATSRPTKLDRYKPFLRRRWNEGITSAVALHAELQAKGWQGSVQAVERYVQPFRAMTAAPPPGQVIPSTRQITRWLLTRPATLTQDEQAQLPASGTAART